jgi:hypothetical protein
MMKQEGTQVQRAYPRVLRVRILGPLRRPLRSVVRWQGGGACVLGNLGFHLAELYGTTQCMLTSPADVLFYRGSSNGGIR